MATEMRQLSMKPAWIEVAPSLLGFPSGPSKFPKSETFREEGAEEKWEFILGFRRRLGATSPFYYYVFRNWLQI
ncbi:hypothetical protein NC653_006535 [Populus alba x Populus x berolinensis]|uniref:Uncharacterized protein n=1 Tax=Populus alba x Populus x berolinensis TaxID=444605 RepID=A0AAD6WCQ7_9ROSI|nr:hypothetical protein NC653_006535 [Populus alba x Populus x berolinensis]